MKRFVLVVLVVALGLVVAAPAAGSTDIPSPKAQISTKRSTDIHRARTRISKKRSTVKAEISKKKKCKKGWKLKRGKCVKKKKPPVVVPPPPAPLALTDSEVKSQVNQKAFEYCLPDPYCYSYGIYVEYLGGPIACSSKSTYSWSCYGWNDEYYLGSFYTCDFREVVERDGYSGIKSHQDTTFGYSGWLCY